MDRAQASDNHFNVDLPVFDGDRIGSELCPGFVEASPGSDIILPAMCGAGDRVDFDLAARDRGSHVFAVGFQAIELPINSDDSDCTGKDLGGSNTSLGQVLLATDADPHGRNIVLSPISGTSETCGYGGFKRGK